MSEVYPEGVTVVLVVQCRYFNVDSHLKYDAFSVSILFQGFEDPKDK